MALLIIARKQQISPPITTIKYGLLYNWWVTQGALIPAAMAAAGWGVPTDANFTTLANHLGGAGVGGKLKEMGTTYWYAPNTGAINEVGFNGRGSGGRGTFIAGGTFERFKTDLFIWSTNGFFRCVYNGSWYALITIDSSGYKAGNSFRLVRLAVAGDPAADGSACTPYIGNDGKVYRTVRIGTQVWLADNLAETKWNDGITYIQGWNAGGHVVISDVDWAALLTAAVCVYDNDESNM